MPSLHTEKSPLLGLKFVPSPYPTSLPPRRVQTSPTRQQTNQQQEQMRMALLYFIFLLVVPLSTVVYFMKQSTYSSHTSGVRGESLKMENEAVLSQIMLEQTDISPLLRQSSSSMLATLEGDLFPNSPSSSPTDQQMTGRASSSHRHHR